MKYLYLLIILLLILIMSYEFWFFVQHYVALINELEIVKKACGYSF